MERLHVKTQPPYNLVLLDNICNIAIAKRRVSIFKTMTS